MSLIARRIPLFGESPDSMKNTLVVASASGSRKEEVLELIESRRNLYDLVEIRADLIGNGPEDAFCIMDEIENRHIPYIFTYRSDLAEDAESIYNSALSYRSSAIDLDLGLKHLRRMMVGHSTIISYHGVPVPVTPILKEMSSMGATVCKIAMEYTERKRFLDDLGEACRFKNETGIPTSFIPMGESFTGDRFLSAMAVSDLLYVSLDKPTAPGQPSLDEAQRLRIILSQGSDYRGQAGNNK